VLSAQAIRHVHVYSIGYEESIIAAAGEFYGVTEEVRMKESTDELLAEYKTIQKKIKQLQEADPSKEQLIIRQENAELFARDEALAAELRAREEVNREIRRGWF
jgi:DNA repair exonuclease SbcCD ATPase subunit